jgi:hypothetical protein
VRLAKSKLPQPLVYLIHLAATPAIRWAASVDWILCGSPTLWTQITSKKKLGTSIPTVFQRNIIGILLNAVRIRRDNKDGVLHTTKLDIKVTIKYIRLCTLALYISCEFQVCKCMYMYIACMYMFEQCMHSYLWIHSMKAVFWHIKWITSGTHDAGLQNKIAPGTPSH